MKKILIATIAFVVLSGLLTTHPSAQDFSDFGDAPEGDRAYPVLGVPGTFPTCIEVGPPNSWIKHSVSDEPSLINIGLEYEWDSENDGNHGLCPSFDPNDFDECYMDGDAGLLFPSAFRSGSPCVEPGTSLGKPCQTAIWGANIDINVTNSSPEEARLNVLMDWDQNGSWGGTSMCPLPFGISVPEHVLDNFPVPPSYSGELSALGPPPFNIGPNPGYVWTRFTITWSELEEDWTGAGDFDDGETEDYMLLVEPWQIMDPETPLDVNKNPFLNDDDLSCWMATAANMLAAAGYGWGLTPQERAEGIYSQMKQAKLPNGKGRFCGKRGKCTSGNIGQFCLNDTECGENGFCNNSDKFCSGSEFTAEGCDNHEDCPEGEKCVPPTDFFCNSGWTDVALNWWLENYGCVGAGKYNSYKKVDRFGRVDPAYLNPHVPRDIGNKLRKGQFVSIFFFWPQLDLTIGHINTVWGDNGGPGFSVPGKDYKEIYHDPTRLIVSDSDINFFANDHILGGTHIHEYKAFDPLNGWNIQSVPLDLQGHGEDAYILSITTLSQVDSPKDVCNSYGYFEQPNTIVLSQEIQNPLSTSATGLYYTVGANGDEIVYFKSLLFPTSSLWPIQVKEEVGYPPTQITVIWDFSNDPIPPGTDVKIFNEFVSSGNNGVSWVDGPHFLPSEGPQTPAFNWKVTPGLIPEPYVKFITGGYLIGSFKFYSIPGDELISEHRFQSQYSYKEDPEIHTFELRSLEQFASAADDPQTYTVRELSFGHSYGLLDEESLWAFDDWMTVESDHILLPDETIMVNIDWEGQLPYPSYDSFNPMDLDSDRDIDLDDFTIFSGCFSGSGVPVTIECSSADFDLDGDVDCNDWAQFMLAWTGPGDLPELQSCTPDTDVDGIPDPLDNCPNTHNSIQKDTYPPPDGNSIGDACDCEANFDCDLDVDADDVTEFLNHFGRSQYFNPCINLDPCSGDTDCDGNVDADDVTKFLEDFGRSTYFNPCPACSGADWCDYGQMVTIAPALVTECPEVPTECPLVPTECPVVETECPEFPTECPLVPTECPEVPTACPELPTACPELATACPELATICPELPTACPEIPTACPELPTACPEIPTTCPEDPTNCPTEPTLCFPMDTDADSIDDCYDNCPNHPNGPGLGTCTSGTVGELCVNDSECGVGGFCSMNQEDTDGNGIGDACELRFTKNGDGAVTDNDTGLVWLKDSLCDALNDSGNGLDWEDAKTVVASLASGTCGLTDGSSATDWRLPTKEEWEEFVCTQYTDPALCNTAGTGQWTSGDPFLNVQSFYNAWSSTVFPPGGAAYGVNIDDGSINIYSAQINLYVWPVRNP